MTDESGLHERVGPALTSGADAFTQQGRNGGPEARIIRGIRRVVEPVAGELIFGAGQALGRFG
jgi:hypothetical protein